MPEFIKGMDLSRAFLDECVAPLISKHYPGLIYSAGRLGAGSDVLGFDTPQSRDHDWGPRVDLYLRYEDFECVGRPLYDTLAMELPFHFKGYSTHFADDYLMGETNTRPIIHRARVYTVESFFRSYIGFNPTGEVSEATWLRTPEQKLRTIRSGMVFHDGLDVFRDIKAKLYWYPDDLWIYLLACQWRRIDQEEPFMARCGDVEDELGSRVVASRLVRDVMKLCFLMEKEYAPYYKWFGTAFSRLACAGILTPLLEEVFVTTNWKDREKILSAIYFELAEIHNRLGLTDHIKPEIAPFHNRPYLVPHSERFWDALMERVKSPRLRSLNRLIGSVNQFIDSTDVLCWNEKLDVIAGVYNTLGYQAG